MQMTGATVKVCVTAGSPRIRRSAISSAERRIHSFMMITNEHFFHVTHTLAELVGT